MKVLITGASSGIGKGLAIELSKQYDELVLVGRNIERLNETKDEILKLNNQCIVHLLSLDLSDINNAYKLFALHKDVDLLIQSAGFGSKGEFINLDLESDLEMINTNITTLHILTKLYLKEMVKRDSGHILNVSSIAGTTAGPLMSTYYATKNYVLRLCEAIRIELKKKKSKVKISVLCPGPVNTNFFKNAKSDNNYKAIDPAYVVKYTIKHLNRFYIIPTFSTKMGFFFTKIIPTRIVSNFIYSYKEKK